MEEKETARKLGDPMVVCTYPDVCKSPVAPVPYQIVAPLTPSVKTADTVHATRVSTFTMKSEVPSVIGDEPGTGKGVVSGTHAGQGTTVPIGSSSTVRAEGALVVRNNDPFTMNNKNTRGKLVYDPGGGPAAKVNDKGEPTRDTNPPVAPQPKEKGWLGWAGDKARGAWDWAKGVNETYKVVPRALGGLQAVGGAGEMVLGAAGLAAPTGVTQVAGGIAVVHGADNVGTGLRQVWTGNYENTLTHQAAAGTARALGASEGLADNIGMATDLGVGIAAPATAAKGLAQRTAQNVARETEEAAARKAAREAEEEAAKRKAAQEAQDGVRVVKKPEPPDTSKVKYPDDMSPYKKPDGTWDWERVAPNNGFAGTPAAETLQPGTVLDRFGGDGGRFLSPAGTPFESRALSPDSLGAPYRAYEVMRPLPVQSGGIAPAFGMPGGGTQYFTGGSSVRDLVNGGYLRELH